MIQFLKQLLDWIYKNKCYCCKNTIPTGHLCDDCFNEIELFYPEEYKNLNGTRVYISGNYKNNLRDIIRALKYYKKTELSKNIAQIMNQTLEMFDDKQEDFEIIPVPMYKKRQKKRKYNHMELIADELSQLSGYSVNKELISRIKDTKPQFKLKIAERRENLKDAFIVNKDKISSDSVLIIDDICTTGSTIEELVKELNQAGIYNITALVCAGAVGSSIHQY